MNVGPDSSNQLGIGPRHHVPMSHATNQQGPYQQDLNQVTSPFDIVNGKFSTAQPMEICDQYETSSLPVVPPPPSPPRTAVAPPPPAAIPPAAAAASMPEEPLVPTPATQAELTAAPAAAAAPTLWHTELEAAAEASPHQGACFAASSAGALPQPVMTTPTEPNQPSPCSYSPSLPEPASSSALPSPPPAPHNAAAAAAPPPPAPLTPAHSPAPSSPPLPPAPPPAHSMVAASTLPEAPAASQQQEDAGAAAAAPPEAPEPAAAAAAPLLKAPAESTEAHGNVQALDAVGSLDSHSELSELGVKTEPVYYLHPLHNKHEVLAVPAGYNYKATAMLQQRWQESQSSQTAGPAEPAVKDEDLNGKPFQMCSVAAPSLQLQFDYSAYLLPKRMTRQQSAQLNRQGSLVDYASPMSGYAGYSAPPSEPGLGSLGEAEPDAAPRKRKAEGPDGHPHSGMPNGAPPDSASKRSRATVPSELRNLLSTSIHDVPRSMIHSSSSQQHAADSSSPERGVGAHGDVTTEGKHVSPSKHSHAARAAAAAANADAASHHGASTSANGAACAVPAVPRFGRGRPSKAQQEARRKAQEAVAAATATANGYVLPVVPMVSMGGPVRGRGRPPVIRESPSFPDLIAPGRQPSPFPAVACQGSPTGASGSGLRTQGLNQYRLIPGMDYVQPSGLWPARPAVAIASRVKPFHRRHAPKYSVISLHLEDPVPGDRLQSLLQWLRSTVAGHCSPGYDASYHASLEHRYMAEVLRARRTRQACELSGEDPLATPANVPGPRPTPREDLYMQFLDMGILSRRSVRMRSAPTQIYNPSFASRKTAAPRLYVGAQYQAPVLSAPVFPRPLEPTDRELALLGTPLFIPNPEDLPDPIPVYKRPPRMPVPMLAPPIHNARHQPLQPADVMHHSFDTATTRFRCGLLPLRAVPPVSEVAVSAFALAVVISDPAATATAAPVATAMATGADAAIAEDPPVAGDPPANGMPAKVLEPWPPQQLYDELRASLEGVEDLQARHGIMDVIVTALDAGMAPLNEVLGLTQLGSKVRQSWCPEDEEAFVRGIREHDRKFSLIQRDFLPHKSMSELISYYYNVWKIRYTKLALEWHIERQAKKAEEPSDTVTEEMESD